MKRELNNKILFWGFASVGLFWANIIKAQVCPVCVVAIGAGLGFSRWFGIDDIISSVWIGALLFSLTSWTLIYMRKKGWSFNDDGIVVTLLYVILTYIPLYYAGIVGHPQNQIWGIDKIIAGSTIGAAVVYFGYLLNVYLKKKNNGKVFFPYQRVAVPVLCLLVISLILWTAI